MIPANTKPKLKRIEDLSLKEVDMAYSLSRIGWSCLEIGRRYGISEGDVRKLVDDYVEIRESCKTKPPDESQHANPEPDPTTKKPRKRRCDAMYATAKDRQAAYRARLRDNRHADGEQLSRTDETDTACQTDEQLSVTVGRDSVIETSPENADPQHSTPYCPSEERCVTSENMTDPVTVEGSSQSEVLWVIEQ
jgi:hypothetical protein